MESLLHRFAPRWFFVRLLPFLITVFVLTAITSFPPKIQSNQASAYPTSSESYLALSISPPIVVPGAMITLHIAYHNIGMPYTDILVIPSDTVIFEPELSMPCKYNEHPNGCTAITFRTQKTGIVTFRASATGEVYREDCHCWYWSGGSDNGPASVIVAGTVWTTFLPVLQR
jgi:hypothetical protein